MKERTVNHISECSKLAQNQYKWQHDWVGKVIHWELCKRLNFDRTEKWYMYKPESILENEIHNFFLDSETQTDYQILARNQTRPSVN